jgi:hypothetical protein
MKYFLHTCIKVKYQQRVTIEAYDAIIQQLIPNTMPSLCPKNESRNNPYKLSRGQLNPVLKHVRTSHHKSIIKPFETARVK